MSIEKPKFEEKYNIIGKDIIPEKEAKISSFLENKKNEAMESIEGEYIKTPEELTVIKLIDQYLNEELKELGIKKTIEILPNQVHLLPTSIYNKTHGGSPKKEKPAAFFDPHYQGIYVNRDKAKGRTNLYHSIMHESIHQASFLRFSYKEERDTVKIDSYRVGYSVDGQEHEHFRGLNEMMIEKIIPEIIKKHEKELVKKLKITPEEDNQTVKRYPSELLDIIIKEVAKRNDEKEEETWQRFKKGLFTGELMHLREVERTFGKGSLRILAALESGTRGEVGRGKAYNRILEYFSIDNEEKREQIAEEILVDREKAEYKKLRQ